MLRPLSSAGTPCTLSGLLRFTRLTSSDCGGPYFTLNILRMGTFPVV
nr:MAG TPA: hypothetical protein [Caudoviricetes sp.]